MERIVRAVPVKSREDLVQLAKDIDNFPIEQKRQFSAHFGPSVAENWYYQEIEGKPYLIAVVEGDDLETPFSKYPGLDDPYFKWFRERVLELSGVDLAEVPTGATSEFIYEQTHIS